MNIGAISSVLGHISLSDVQDRMNKDNDKSLLFKEILNQTGVNKSSNDNAIKVPEKIDNIDSIVGDNVNKLANNNIEPSNILVSQMSMANITTEISLTAKAASSISQGINKLVNIQ